MRSTICAHVAVPAHRRRASVGKLIEVMLQLVQLELAANGLQLAGQAVLASILAGVGELRDHDRGKNAEDDHHDQDFHQRETRLEFDGDGYERP